MREGADTIHRARAYRLYPTQEQAQRLASWVGATRFVYNLALEQRRSFCRPGRRITWAQQCREIKDLRHEADWIADVPSTALHQALTDLERAFNAWRTRRGRYPRFRKAEANDAIRIPAQEGVRLTGSSAVGYVRLPRIGEVRLRHAGLLHGRLISVTVRRVADRWYAMALHEIASEAATPVATSVGVDRGVSVFAALSSGELIEGPNVGRRAAASLARAQRRMARKVKGSNNRRKARLRVARLHKRVSDARKDFLHKVSTNIAKSHGVVVMEDLKVRNMTASAKGTVEAPGRNVRQKAGLNRAILDQGWGMFRQMLAYKLEERGGVLLTVDPKDTSRTCSACGVVDPESREGARFSCRACGHTTHADTNAAINILRRGAPLTPVELAPAFREAGNPAATAFAATGAPKSEATRHD